MLTLESSRADMVHKTSRRRGPPQLRCSRARMWRIRRARAVEAGSGSASHKPSVGPISTSHCASEVNQCATWSRHTKPTREAQRRHATPIKWHNKRNTSNPRARSDTQPLLPRVTSFVPLRIVCDQHNEIMFWGGYAHQGMQSAPRADTVQTMCAMVNM
jgi:hypothetical protein